MMGLVQCFPASFGGDAPYFKKASLLLLTMEIALNQLGHHTVALTLPPADYRIPQILEGLGLLRFSDQLNSQLEIGHLFEHRDPEVRAMRTMTVEAVGHVREAYQRLHGRAIGIGELDGMLYLLSRNPNLMARRAMKQHIKVATAAF